MASFRAAVTLPVDRQIPTFSAGRSHLSKVRLSSVKSPVDLVGTAAGKTLG
jgi:hypothetical protein